MQTEQTEDTSYSIMDDMLKEQEKVEVSVTNLVSTCNNPCMSTLQLSPQWLLSFESTEVAKQLALLEQSYYMRIEPMYVSCVNHVTL